LAQLSGRGWRFSLNLFRKTGVQLWIKPKDRLVSVVPQKQKGRREAGLSVDWIRSDQ
jgi:hypothetical protein